MNKKWSTVVLATMCFILTVCIVIQYKTVSNASKIAGTSVNSELKTEVLKWKERYEQVYATLEKSEAELEMVREQASTNNIDSSEMQQQLKTLNALIGTTDVQGPGIVITIADNNTVTNEDSLSVIDNISNYLIHDRDLLRLVNELKNAGAEAISINEERIINTTSITCDGNVILINGNKISSPFIIKAIGSQEAILGAIERPGGLLRNEFYRYGLVSSIERKEKVTIYKYNGVINYKTIKK